MPPQQIKKGYLTDQGNLNSSGNGALEFQSVRPDISKKEITNLLENAYPSIILIEETGTKSELSRGIFKAKKLLLAAEILNYSLFKHAALFAAQKAIKIAHKYQVLEVIFLANRIIATNAVHLKKLKLRASALKDFHK